MLLNMERGKIYLGMKNSCHDLEKSRIGEPGLRQSPARQDPQSSTWQCSGGAAECTLICVIRRSATKQSSHRLIEIQLQAWHSVAQNSLMQAMSYLLIGMASVRRGDFYAFLHFQAAHFYSFSKYTGSDKQCALRF